jgi:PPOX class probable F420-dependent enzyme
MEIADAVAFVRDNHRAVLATRRRDGGTQMSPVTCAVGDDGSIVISSRETAIKTKNVRREPRAALCVLNDGFFGEWVQLEGPTDVVSLPDAMELLVEYYRSVSGEHPDWDDYRNAMAREKRCVIRITPDRAGPTVSG